MCLFALWIMACTLRIVISLFLYCDREGIKMIKFVICLFIISVAIFGSLGHQWLAVAILVTVPLIVVCCIWLYDTVIGLDC